MRLIDRVTVLSSVAVLKLDNKMQGCYVGILLAFILLPSPYLFLTSSGKDSEVLVGILTDGYVKTETIKVS